MTTTMDEDKTVGQLSNLTFDNALEHTRKFQVQDIINSRQYKGLALNKLLSYAKYCTFGATKILTSFRLRSQYL